MSRRWNGWGSTDIHYPFPASAEAFLQARIGPGRPAAGITKEQALGLAPRSRLPTHPAVHTEPEIRLVHACGQSLPDWVAVHSGINLVFPDGVGFPENDVEIRDFYSYARSCSAAVIPYGGGTSVVGHINPVASDQPVLTLDLSRMNRLLEFDEVSRLAVFEAGVSGPEIESQLNRLGFTLGHFPQSFELSTLGGWIATRSSGQQSYYYGRIEDLFAGGHVETPCGALELPAFPASAAGPDLRQVLLGSEGRLGIITRAVVRVRRVPAWERFYGIFFPCWEAGVNAVRRIAQEAVSVSMVRLSNPQETETTLALSGKDRLVSWANRGLSIVGYRDQRCLLVLGITGETDRHSEARSQAYRIARWNSGLPTGEIIGKIWKKSRFLTPYLRNTLWEHGYAVDTLETALPWKQIQDASQAIPLAIESALVDMGERAWVFAHLSHVYGDGASIYVTYVFRRTPDPDETVERWLTMKSAASRAILRFGGTISHQHGVGSDHAPYLEAEKGRLGMDLLRRAASLYDPDQMLNPGKLFR